MGFLLKTGTALFFVLAFACHNGEGSAPAADTRASAPPGPSASPTIAGSAVTSFVDREWRVQSSTAVAVGTRYTFKSDGTLLISSPGSTPSIGSWSRSGNGLVMVEESMPYQVDILSLSDSRFAIRSHNPGQPVDITLVPTDSP